MESTLDERFGGTLAPDAMLPSQFFAALRSRGDLSAERRLVVAVLEDALHCFQKYVDAEEWIMGDNPTWFFSFANVCDSLSLDPDYMREGLSKWRRAHVRAAQRQTPPSATAAGDEADEARPLKRASGA